MDSIKRIIKELEKSPGNVRFSDLCRICDQYFGDPRQKSTSHRAYKTPWKGDPRINIQNKDGKAKAYQVRQVIRALKKLEGQDDEKKE